MEITEIKQRLPLAELLRHYNLKPDKHLRLHCPFHDDKTPSMQVYYKTHTVYCFSGSCKTGGKSLDVIDFVIKSGGIQYTEKKMNEYKNKALEILNTFPESDSKKALAGLVRYTTERKN